MLLLSITPECTTSPFETIFLKHSMTKYKIIHKDYNEKHILENTGTSLI